jgi:hypothetical protein
MKYIKTFKESVEYSDEYGEYDIEKVTRDKRHDYEYCDGILYELSGSGNEKIVSINDIEHTPENIFYDNQVDSYIKYINDGGILQTFPVYESHRFDNLGQMVDFIDEFSDEAVDIFHDLYYGKNDKFYNITKERFGIGIFDLYIDDYFDGISGLEDITDVNEIEEYWLEDNEEYDYKKGLITLFNHLRGYEEYRLDNFNHRLQALNKLGKERVYVDVIV